MEEIWKPIGIANYAVSNLGTVKGKNGIRILKPRFKKDGYITASIQQNDKSIHSLVMKAFVGERPDGMVIDHINRDKHDNRLENLRYATKSENQQNTDRWDRNELHGKEWQNEYQKKYREEHREKQIECMRLYNRAK